MSRTLIGMATFGLKNFSELTINRIRQTVKEHDYEIFAVVGKPDDSESVNYFDSQKIPFSYHEWNRGFPAAVNDIYDFAWKLNDFDYCIIIGNDVLPYPTSIDSMIQVADTTDYEWICANQFDVRSLCSLYPEARKYFEGDRYIFNFQGEPWDLATVPDTSVVISPGGMSDVQNLCLYKKSVFDAIGYTDANFYPAYYIDNDYARRGVNAHIKSCTLPNSVYFHFWSRVIHQGNGGSTHKYFEQNRKFYMTKWGGDFGKETWTTPFNGKTYFLGGYIPLTADLKIGVRDSEEDIAKFWIRNGR